MTNQIYISMFGEFSISYGDKKLTDQVYRSKKIWSLLAYLITFRNKDISQNELIELLWEEDEIGDPANTLKTLLHRLRNMIKTLGLENTKKIILSINGAYVWNKVFDCIVDTDIFEQLYAEAYDNTIDKDEKLEKLLQAIDIYKGDFLIKNGLEPWVVPISTYFRSKYIKAVCDCCELLLEEEDYQQIVDICQKAIMIDAYEEPLYIYLIKALISTKKLQQALSYYDYVKDLFFSKFGVNLSEDLTSLYTEIKKATNVIELDLNIIKKTLQEQSADEGCFFCEYEAFKTIYRLEARSAIRTGQVVYVCLFTITDLNQEEPPKKLLKKSMTTLEEIIGSSLRQGDVVTQYSLSQYLLMLPTTTFENGHMVLERIVQAFYKKMNKSNLLLKYSLQAISPKSSLKTLAK